MAKRHATEAQRLAAKEKRQRMRELAKRIAGMTPEQQAELTKGDIATIEGRALSLHNQMMVAYQGCRSTVVGGFQQWKKAGRIVRKGEHGYSIWIPCGAAKPDDDEGEDGKVYFALGTVFGIDQTDPLGDSPETAPETKPKARQSMQESRLAAMAELTGVAA